jgi:hypothetical protein
MNGETFLAYIEQCLVPTLKRRDIVVVDNVPFHKVRRMLECGLQVQADEDVIGTSRVRELERRIRELERLLGRGSRRRADLAADPPLTTAPDLPPEPGVHTTFARDHEYKRHGTVSLAGIDLLTGKVHALVRDRHRSREFVEFLKLLDAAYARFMLLRWLRRSLCQLVQSYAARCKGVQRTRAYIV